MKVTTFAALALLMGAAVSSETKLLISRQEDPETEVEVAAEPDNAEEPTEYVYDDYSYEEDEEIVNDAEKSVQELLDELNPFGLKYWKWLDVTMGLTIGLWLPYIQRARSYDCQSEMFALGVEIIDWYMLTDPYWWRGFADTYSLISVAGNALNQIGLLWRVIDTCAAQYTFSLTNAWLSKMYT